MTTTVYFPLTPVPAGMSGYYRESHPYGPTAAGGFESGLGVEIDPARLDPYARALAVVSGLVRVIPNTASNGPISAVLRPDLGAATDLSAELGSGNIIFVYRGLDPATVRAAALLALQTLPDVPPFGSADTDQRANRYMAGSFAVAVKGGERIGSVQAGTDGAWAALGFEIVLLTGVSRSGSCGRVLGLQGVLDRSKIGAAALFYLPSAPGGLLDVHQEIIIPGAPIDAEWLTAIMAARQIEADRVAAIAQADAAARREAKLAAGFDPTDSLIEKLRSRFDLDSVLTGHRYDRAGTKYRHPNSSSGSYGADIKVLGGIERVFSHNGTDPLHADNHPAWCDGVTALDVVDVVTILDFGGDRTRALRELAKRFGLAKEAERTALARLIFRMIKRQATQEEIEAAATAERQRLGLSHAEVCRVARWVAGQFTQSREAA